jgi:diacylglycerol kinase (ATP)
VRTVANNSKILFIVNPHAGKISDDQTILSIHHLVLRDNLDFKFHYTRGENDDALIKEQIDHYKPDRVVACGGDGTLQMVARNLIYSKIPMGILPAGSANGLAKALGIPTDVNEAITIAALTKKTKPLDLLKINGKHWCIHLSDVGINALLIKNYAEAGDKGMMGYAKHLVAAIQQSELRNYTINTPEGTFRKTGFMLAFANAHKYGTGVQISEGSVSDGKFEISNVEKIDTESVIKAGLTALNVFIDKNMFSDVISCTRADVTIDRKTHFQIDGEYMGEIDHLVIEIVPSAIDLLI